MTAAGRPGDPAADWSAHLDAVEASVREFERVLETRGADVDGTADVLAALPVPLPAPSSPWPTVLEPRRREVLAALTRATAAAEHRRELTARRLAGLRQVAPGSPATGARTVLDGARLDIVG